MAPRQAILEAATRYLRRHPEELVRLLKNAVGLRLGVPIDGLRWLVRNGRGPQDVEIEAVPPGLRLAATLELMKTPVRASSIVYIENVCLSDRECKVALRLEQTNLVVLADDAETPVAALIRSGALDLTKTGSLAAHLPKLQALLSESAGNRLVVDLTKHPAFSDGQLTRRVLALVTSFVTVGRMEADVGHMDVGFRLFPRGLRGAMGAVREHVWAPARPWIRGMLNPGR